MAITNKPSTTTGVSNYTFWELEEDTAAEATYSEPYSLRGTVQITLTDTGGSATFGADNEAYETFSYVEKIGHELENADIPPEIEALWRGLEVDEFGGVTYGKNTKNRYFGVAWVLEKANGSRRYFRSYKGSYSFASNAGGKTRPSDGAPEFQTAKSTYTAVARDFDDVTYYYIDDTNLTDEQKKEIAVKWFVDIDYLPTKTTVTP